MDIRQLRYFTKIVSSDYNLTKASESLMVSQPALSKMVIALEDELGVELFLRQKGRLTGVTPAGKLLLLYSRQILRLYAEMSERIVQIAHQHTDLLARVSIGIPGNIRSILFNDLLQELIYDFPDISFNVLELEALDLKQKFEEGEIDILASLSVTPDTASGILTHSIASEPYVAIMAESNPLSTRRQLNWRDLDNIPLALPGKKYFTTIFVVNKMLNEGVYPYIAVESTLSDFLIHSTLNNNIVTVLPRIFYERYKQKHEDTVCVPFSDPLIWNVYLSMRYSDMPDENVFFAYTYLLRHFGYAV